MSVFELSDSLSEALLQFNTCMALIYDILYTVGQFIISPQIG